MVRRVVKKRAGAPDRRIIHPERDWIIGVGLSTLLFVSGALYTGHEFLTHLEKADERISVESTIVQYDQKTVAEVLQRYGARRATFETLRADRSNAAPVVIDEAETGVETEAATSTLAEDEEDE